MARRPRLEYAGAVYHVMDRGDRGEDIFLDPEDHHRFLLTLGQACERAGWRIHRLRGQAFIIEFSGCFPSFMRSSLPPWRDAPDWNTPARSTT